MLWRVRRRAGRHRCGGCSSAARAGPSAWARSCVIVAAVIAHRHARPSVDRRRRDGLLELHPCHPDAERRARRLGRGEPSSRAWSARRGDGRRHRARMPAVDAAPDRRHQRRREVGFPTGDGRRLPRSCSSPRRADELKPVAPAPAPVAPEIPTEPPPAKAEATAESRQRHGKTEPAAPAAPVRRAPNGPAFADPSATA